MKRKIVLIIFGLFFLINSSFSATIPAPEDVLGFKVGTDRKLADMHHIIDYFHRLDRASRRVVVREVGKTTMGNPFIVAVITSEENHRNLEKYRSFQHRLADPRTISDQEAEKIIKEGKSVVMINCSIHATEIGASQMSIKLAYDLATGNDRRTREILDNVIILLLPMHNPDGVQMVVDWYRKHLGTKYEGCRMPWLYHKYVGHDNNRDWYMFTQVESRLTIKVHNAWHPHIILDMHQMGNRGARIFVPPFVDPYEPNVDPIIQQEVAMMGTFIASELTAEGKPGVVHSLRFDAWTPARAYHHYHGGIRVLTEVASAKLATPVTIKFEELADYAKKPTVKMPLPWKGGKWRLKDIVDYDYSAAMAALTNASRLRENWLRNFYRVHKKAVMWSGPPFAFLIPQEQRDFKTAVKMMNVLKLGGVEIHRARDSFLADGHPYPRGTYIIYLSQPYGCYAKALLERQDYPEIREYPGGPLKAPYDVVAHTLPLLMGVETVRIEKPFEVKAELVDRLAAPSGRVEEAENSFAYLWSHSTNDDLIALNRFVKDGFRVFWSAEKFEVEGGTYPPGTMIVLQEKGLASKLKSMASELNVHFKALRTRPVIEAYELRPLKLGLYKSWTASMDEGWTRWVLEQYEFPYCSLYNSDIRKGDLRKSFDVIVLPDMGEEAIVNGVSERDIPPQYAGGIGEVGVENMKDFVEEGGTLITLNTSAEFPLKRFYLGVENTVESLGRKEFFIPGSILKVLNETSHPVAYGFERQGAVFFRRSPVFAVSEGRAVVKYPVRNPLLSGWITGERHLHNRSAVVDVSYGKGKVILIGFPALYRGQAHATFRYLFNAIYYGPAKLTKF
ncbi:MAG: M14 metallopeptidase family protein [Candidatus Aminicenantales bacterium]